MLITYVCISDANQRPPSPYSGCFPSYPGRHTWQRWGDRLCYPDVGFRLDDRRSHLLHLYRYPDRYPDRYLQL